MVSGISFEEGTVRNICLTALLLETFVKQTQCWVVSKIPALFSFYVLIWGHDPLDVSVCLAVDICGRSAGPRVTSYFPFLPPHFCCSIYRRVPQRRAEGCRGGLFCSQSPLEINTQRDCRRRQRQHFLYHARALSEKLEGLASCG